MFAHKTTVCPKFYALLVVTIKHEKSKVGSIN